MAGKDTVGLRIKEARKALQLSQVSLARLVGVDQSTVALWETDKTQPREDKLQDVARVLFLTPEYMRYGSGPAIDAPGRTIPVIGYIGAGNEVHKLAGKSVQETPAPPRSDPSDPVPTAALIVKGNSMWPVYRDGDMLFYDDKQRAKPADMVGTECVVQVRGGAMVVKRIMSGSRKNLFTLSSYNAPEIKDVAIEWAAPILWVRRNHMPPTE